MPDDIHSRFDLSDVRDYQESDTNELDQLVRELARELDDPAT
jgi:hypothetical protein